MAADMSGLERDDRLGGAVLEAVTEGEQAEHARLRRGFHQPGERPALRFPGLRGGSQLARWQTVVIENPPVAQRQLALVEAAGDAAAGQRLALPDVG
ncbi:hypothetical protein D3C77_699440 [compost metagenome]